MNVNINQNPKPKIVVLASGSGTLFKAILESELGQFVRALISDVPDCGAVNISRDAGVPYQVVPLIDFPTRADWDHALLDAVNACEPDLIVCAGFMRILAPNFIDAYPSKILNSHPALLPSFPGAHAVRDALAANAAVTGCTVHFVDSGVDTGPVVAQESVEIEPGESEVHLHERIKAIERVLLPKTMMKVLVERELLGGNS